MRKLNRFQSQCLSILFVLMVLVTQGAFSADNIVQIKQAIAEKGANWTAGESWVTQLSFEEQKQLCGGRLPTIDPARVKLISLPRLVSAPPIFDWRDNNGNWITPVKDQGWSTTSLTFICGSCWDFAAVAAIESWWKIHYAQPDSQIDLSEQFVLSCGELDCWSGGSAAYVYDMACTMGIPTEACFPYQADDTIPCDSVCDNWEQEAITIPGWGYITLNEANIENLKSALFRRPVVAYLDVYQDFLYYSAGVYEHVWGNALYGHLVVIVGWNDYEQSWICKNSFGSSWGDKGYFRIKWGECQIGIYCPYIWDNLTGGPALATTPTEFDLTVVAGDSLVAPLTIRNLGTEPLEYVTYDNDFKAYFHPDSYMAHDSLSWWCGDPQIGGYQNSWLQYLDTPVLDLAATNQPHLSWMGYWAMEDTTGISGNPLYDGWDGCNVWVSTDGGETFVVAEPIKPKYTSRNLYSFGSCWGMGKGIAGWGGSSGGWQKIEFDLSSYRSDSTVVRFAFASDEGMATPDNPQLHGFFVDDITITDGSKILFEDHGNDASHMVTHGQTQSPADWMEAVGAAGRLAGGESAVAQLVIGTRGLEPGKYHGGLTILSNDTTAVKATVPVKLRVIRPDHDVQVQQAWPVTEQLPILVPLRPRAKVKNQGCSNEMNFKVMCTALLAGQAIYSDTCFVASLRSEADKNIQFKPIVFQQTGDADFIISLSDVPHDHNSYNDQASSSARISYLVDGFEAESGFWDREEGWTVASGTAHSGKGMASTQKKPSLNCRLTFKPGFDLSLVDKATLKFWTRYNTEKDKDVCYVEASPDSLFWTRLDSLSGRQWSQWVQRQVALSQFTGPGNKHVWLRFHFISDSVNTYTGVFIDDIEIYPENPTAVWANRPEASQPTIWSLSQNYPNPFNPNTTIEYDLPNPSHIKLVIYDLLGRHIKTLVNSKQQAGHLQTAWDGTDEHHLPVAAGVYLCRMQAEKFVKVIKLVLVK